MSEQDRYIPGVPCWVEAAVPDPDEAAAFYGALFSWELENTLPVDAGGPYLVARLDGEDAAAIAPRRGEAPPAWNTYVWVESADATAAKVEEAGGTVVAPPFDVVEAGRMAVCADREGAAFSLWEPRRHRGAGAVNEPGAVVFNDLSSADLETAKEFYGAVFGWETIELGGGLAWALPGYGEFLDRLNPGTLERVAEQGAPAGFANVVASLRPLDADPAAEQPRWGVTFAAADADATAARAAELGGRVLVEPTDAPWVRTTVIADPQGVTFTASQFVPENRDLTA